MLRALAILVAAILPALPAQAGRPAGLLGCQILRGNDRASMMLAVRNDSDQQIRIDRIAVGGRALAELTEQQGRHKVGQTLDWYDVRPRTVAPGAATTVILGYARKDWLAERPVVELTGQDGERLRTRLPGLTAPPLVVAAVGFSENLRKLTLLVRNDSPDPVELNQLIFNGKPVGFQTTMSTVAPKQLVHIEAAVDNVEFGSDCSIVMTSPAGNSAAWITARPAKTLTYMFYSRWCDPRDLAEKNIDVGNTHREANAEFARQLDEHDLEWPNHLAELLRQRVEHFTKQPDAWAWYVQDDAGWGHPTPSALIAVRRFIREHGSAHPQIICNPADNLRYAWVGDVVMNYSYHVTHQTPDPTQFTGGRSLDLVRRLNEPGPVTYLVDTVGQGVRWITVAEEELASYSILGRGARHLGWFLGPSMWEQGEQYGGATDPFDTRPWRYQEGMTANTEIGNHVRRIAATFRALSDHIAVSAPLPGRLTEQGVEVLPIYAAEDQVVITTLLNRRLRCTYPRDFADAPMASGGIRLEPQHDFSVDIPRPAWTNPRAVIAFDHDRGVRSLPFEVKDQVVVAHMDSLAATAILFTVNSSAVAARIRDMLETIEPAMGGSSIRPDVWLAADAIRRQNWLDPAASYRTDAGLGESVSEGAWVRLDLPVDQLKPWGPNGFFRADSVKAFLAGQQLPVRVDDGKSLTDARGHARWMPARTDDPKLAVSFEESGVVITADYVDGGYGLVRAELEFDPTYPVLDVEHQIDGQIVPLLRYQIAVGSEKRVGTANLFSELDRWQYWPRSRRIVDAKPGRLATTRIDLRQVIAAEQKLDPAGQWRIVALSLDAQVYSGEFRFGRIIQRPYAPGVFVRIRQASDQQPHKRLAVYWAYQDAPGIPAQQTWRPAAPTKLASGPIEIATGDTLTVLHDNRQLRQVRFTPAISIDAAWIEQRDDQGRLIHRADLRAQAGVYRLPSPMELSRERGTVTLWTSRRNGPTVRIDLLGAPGSSLQPFAQVEGQVESLALSPDGQWLVAGAAGVSAVDLAGGIRWTKDLGTNRRQQMRYGPGRNIAKVGMDDTGEHAFAWTYAFDKQHKRWNPASLVVWDSAGQQKHQRRVDWRAEPVMTPTGRLWHRADDDASQARLLDLGTGRTLSTEISAERAAVLDGQPWLEYIGAGWPPRRSVVRTDDRTLYEVTWPAYALHRHVLPDGSLVIATTQGHIHYIDANGRQAWRTTRPSRIEAVVPLEERGMIAIARKEHVHQYDWQARPVVELIDLQTGEVTQSYRGPVHDDYGHLGTDLSLVGDQQERDLVMGDWTGCLYRIALD